jgi:hypothetical protein
MTITITKVEKIEATRIHLPGPTGGFHHFGEVA